MRRPVTSPEEAQKLYEAVERERREWRAAIEVAVQDFTQAIMEFNHAQHQLAIADQRAGRARLLISQSGFPSFARPRMQLRPAQITQNQGNYFLLYSFYAISNHLIYFI